MDLQWQNLGLVMTSATPQFPKADKGMAVISPTTVRVIVRCNRHSMVPQIHSAGGKLILRPILSEITASRAPVASFLF